MQIYKKESAGDAMDLMTAYEGRQQEACGVFGIAQFGVKTKIAHQVYYGLFALQHRGQESAGIAVNDNGTILSHKEMGLVSQVFDPVLLNHMEGSAAIGHVRYSTTGGSHPQNAQPMVIRYRSGQVALAHNGNLVNAATMREKLEEAGAIFHSSNDTEVIVNYLLRYRMQTDCIEEAIKKTMDTLKGSYALTILTPNKLIGVRDPLGIRPLCIGQTDSAYVLASESCALDAVGAAFIRDVEPGEIVTISKEGLRFTKMLHPQKSKLCIFEFVYFARADSVIDGASVCEARKEAGRVLAKEHPADGDIVIGAPDGGLLPAMGFSEQSGIPLVQGLIKNKYVGRSFIRPNQQQRDADVRIKFNAIRSEIQNKNVIMIDDSIVRGTTTGRIIRMLQDSGANKVHMRVSSPPYRYPCYYGIDTSTDRQLVAHEKTITQIQKVIGADSLGYLSPDGLLKTPFGVRCGFCTACFDQRYPIHPKGRVHQDETIEES